MTIELPKELLTKLANLKALSERGGTVAEAQTAAAMLQKLLTKHNLAIEVLEGVGREDIDITEQRFTFGKRRRNISAKRCLLHALALSNYASSFSLSGTTDFCIVGTTATIITVKNMYDYLWTAIYKESMRKMREQGDSLERPWNWQNSFCMGAVTAVIARLDAARKEAESEVEGSKDLVLRKEARIESYLAERHSNMKQVAPRARFDRDAKAEGYRFGSRIGLNKQVDQADRKWLG